jgi:hypothetical protein
VRDDRREKDKYGHMSLAEQVGDEVRAFWRAKPLVILVAFLVGGWLILTITKPEPLPVERIAAGDCLYIHALDAAADDPAGRAIGSDTQILASLYRGGAERAPCDGSHSHEAADAWLLGGAAGSPYPGTAALLADARPRCEAAFERHVGRSADGSAFALTIAVPPEPGWERGTRAVVCLVSRDDGSFLSGPARGSGA